MSALLVALGAAVGAPARFVVDLALRRRSGADFPWGTLTVNVLGGLLLGLFLGLPLSPQALALLGTGFCGALTTYSTFAYETVRSARTGAYRYALASVMANLGLGVGAAWAGLTLITLLLD